MQSAPSIQCERRSQALAWTRDEQCFFHPTCLDVNTGCAVSVVQPMLRQDQFSDLPVIWIAHSCESKGGGKG